jgi:Xaa-Pro aminopeptidase
MRQMTPLALLLAATMAQAQTARPVTPALPTWSNQIAIREGWLRKRHELILPMMRHHDIAMWIVVNEEFHDDPIVPTIAPPRPYAGNRDIFVFADDGTALKKFSITGYPEENIKAFFEPMAEGRSPGKMLSELLQRFQPRTIALAMDGTRGVTRGLTLATYELIQAAVDSAAACKGATVRCRLVSAEPLIEEYLDTRIPEERESYTVMVAITDAIAKKALSNAVISPGKTTVGDIRRFLFDEYARVGATTWFQPDIRVQRKGGGDFEVGKHAATPTAPGPALEATVIQRGDVLHVDMGISAMGFHTDWQKMAYVLKPGETDTPAGLKKAMANTNALQDVMMLTCSRPGLPNTEVYDCAMAEMTKRGITAQIYSHPIGNQGHGLGAGIAYGAASGRPAKPLRLGSYISIELNTSTPVAEWGGQAVFVMMEDDAVLTDQGWRFFQPRQQSWYLVR